VGERRRLAAAARHHRAFSYGDPVSNARRSADALRRLLEAKVPLDGASDHGVSEALYVRDPDGNGVELYWDRDGAEWPRTAHGALAMDTRPADLDGLLSEPEQDQRASHHDL
jgi:catechol 2,3-dioxygenase